ncbi:MAG: PD-(D/E)XK nuclease family transposase [Treponema sp.]|nr:PD-(D/E)XK nuclease family transposase [Treponema sp.]
MEQKELMKGPDRETYEKVRNLRLIDDAFFQLAASRKAVCQEILRTLLDDDELVVVEVTVQTEMVSLERKVRLDALCIMSNKELCNIEMQKGNQNDDIRRVRFHASTITSNKTPKGTEFKDVPNVKVVYISEYDALKNNQTITHVCRCQKVGDKYIPIDDGEDIIFANASVDDFTKKSKLLKRFLERDSFRDPDFPELSDVMRYYKETEEGVSVMSSASEEFMEMGARRERINTEREKARADAAEARADAAEENVNAEKLRADAAEARADALQKELDQLRNK